MHVDIEFEIEFQYIKCIGWTYGVDIEKLYHNSFNTSNVSVERDYILIHFHLQTCFNTSNVSVELIGIDGYNYKIEGFNTSNVSVERIILFVAVYETSVSIHQMYRLNT